MNVAAPRRCGLDHAVDIGAIDTPLGRCRVRAFRYPAGGALGIALLDLAGELMWVMSVNLPTAPALEPGQFFAKTYSENEPIVAPALQSGLFTPTGLAVTSGFVEVPVWAVNNAACLHGLCDD